MRPYAILVIEPWHDLSINDYHSVLIQYLNNSASSAVVKGEQERYNLIVAEENMPEGEVPMFGRVVRAGSLQESRSVTQTILIKTTLPGGVDRRVWEPWHSELFLSLEGLPEGSIIDANIAETGVWCLIKKYLNIRKNDVITVVVDGTPVEHIVSPAEAAGRGPIRVFIGPDIFAQISQFGPVGVVFKVRDVVENVSGGKYPYSKPYMLESELDDSLLDYPLLFCDGVECPLIDLDTQSQSVFTVEVTLPRKTPTPNPRNQVIVVLAITKADGTTLTKRSATTCSSHWRADGSVKITVQYSFTRGVFTYKSEVLTLDLLPLAVLPTPIIDGIGDTKVLPLYLLSDTARTRIAPWSLAHKDQRIWMTYEGTFDDDSPFIEKTYIANLVTAAGVTNGIASPTPTDKLLRLKVGWWLKIWFWVSFAQSTDQSTAVLLGVREYLIQGVPATLPAPAFANRVGPTLSIYPLDYETTASVRVAYTGMRSTQSIQVQWIYPDAEIADIPVQKGVDKGFIDVPVGQKILASSLGKIITLRHIATINGVQIESATQTLKVETIRAADLPRPLLNGVANDGVLDLNTFAGDALAAVAKWRLSATGQRVWLTCSSPYVADLVVLDGVAITAVEAVKGLANIAVLRSWLQRVKFRQITVTCKVTFDGSREEQTAIPFLKSTYEIEWQKGIIDSINVGSQPHYIVITRDGSTAYVTNHGSHSVSVIDVPKRKVIRTIDGFNNPFRIVLHPDESRLYVGNLGAKTISVVDTRNDAIIQTIPGFNYIWGLAINASGTLLFANCSVDSRVFVHDAKTGARLASTYVQNAYGLALNPLQTLLYCGGPTKLSILNAAAVEGVIKEVGGFSPATNMAFNLRDLPYSRVYVTGLHAVVIVNTDTNVVHKTLGGFYSAYAVAMNPRVHECYVSSGGSLVTVINTHTESVVRTHTGFANPADVAVEPTGKMVLVANQANGTVSFIAV